MKSILHKLLQTDSKNWTALFTRLAVAVAIFPHGAQKMLGWFGGGGFKGTMGFLTEHMNLPWIVALFVILFEFFGPLFLAVGAFTRLAVLAIAVNFIGVMAVDTWGNGFFMNWHGVEGKGGGFEYFILLYGLLIATFITGGGKASVDTILPEKCPLIGK